MSKILNFIYYYLVPPKLFIKLRFKRTFGYFNSFKNPKTLNEKIQWKKFYDRRNDYTLCSDKYSVRNYVEAKIGKKYLIKLLYRLKSSDEINFNLLPNEYVIKSNHASGQIIIVRNNNLINTIALKATLNEWLNVNFYYYGKEWQYKNIEPCILIEELLLNEEGEIPMDFKFHCFYGEVEFIQVDIDRFGEHKRAFFNTKWKYMDFNWCPVEGNDVSKYELKKRIMRPKNLNDMIKISKKLSRDFDYCRIDLYSCNHKIFFGEITFSHGSGFEKFFPDKYDKIYGDLLKIQNE